MHQSQYNMKVEGNAPGAVMAENANVTMNFPSAPPILMELFQSEYEPTLEAIVAWRLADAEPALRSLLEKVSRTGKSDPGLRQALRDFQQRLLLALATLVQRRGRRREALELWGNAKTLGALSDERKNQELSLLANLGDAELLEQALCGCAYDIEGLYKFRAVLAWLKGTTEQAASLIPSDTQEADMLILLSRIRLSNLKEEDARALHSELDRVWTKASEDTLMMVEAASLTLLFLQHVVDAGWQTSCVDRAALVTQSRERLLATVAALEPLADQFPEIGVRAVALTAQMHLYLGEREHLARCLARLGEWQQVTREKALIGLATNQSWLTEQIVATLEEEGAVFPTEAVVLRSHCQSSLGAKGRALPQLRAALGQNTSISEREFVLEYALRLLYDDGQVMTAQELLDCYRTQITSEAAASLEGSLLLAQGSDYAASYLRSAVAQFPRSRGLLEHLLVSLSAYRPRNPFGVTTLGERLDHERQEAYAYAMRLAEILPSPEARFRLAGMLAEARGPRAAIEEIIAIEAQGYRTRALSLYHAQLLLTLNLSQEAAELLESVRPQYKDDYEIDWQCGTAWALAAEPRRAIELLEPLREHHDAGTELFINLGRAYLLAASTEPPLAAAAFDIYKQALARFPSEPSIPAGLLEAGEASGNGYEAHRMLGSLDLSGNPYLRRVSEEEMIPVLRSLGEQARLRYAYYTAGMAPYAFLVRHAGQAAFLDWWARLGWGKQQWDNGTSASPSILANLPALASSPSSPKRRRRLLMDITSVLTLSYFGALKEVIEALHATGHSVFLFPQAMHWIEHEMTLLQAAQRPLSRQKYADIQRLLRDAPGRALMQERVSPQATPPDERMLQLFGPEAHDVSEAVLQQGYYLSDHAPDTDGQHLHDGMVISSSHLLAVLVSRGLIRPAEARQARERLPEIFHDVPAEDAPDFQKPVFVSESALLAWQEAGLLSLWLEGGVGWPSLVTGPSCSGSIEAQVAQARLYREALQGCVQVRSTLRTALKQQIVRPCPEIPKIKLELGNLNLLWEPSLEVLAVASKHDLVVCADDLFLRLFGNRRGFLPDDTALRTVEAKLYRRFQKVQVMGTEDLLLALYEAGTLSIDRVGELDWTMFEHGYRGNQLKMGLRWLLQQFPWLSGDEPVPYQQLILELMQMGGWLPAEAKGIKGTSRLRSAAALLMQGLVTELWLSSSAAQPYEHTSTLASRLLGCFEEVLRP